MLEVLLQKTQPTSRQFNNWKNILTSPHLGQGHNEFIESVAKVLLWPSQGEANAAALRILVLSVSQSVSQPVSVFSVLLFGQACVGGLRPLIVSSLAPQLLGGCKL